MKCARAEMRRGALLLLVAFAVARATAFAQDTTAPGDTLPIPHGFTAASWAPQKAIEAKFLAGFSRDTAAVDAERISRVPHLAGTPQSEQHARELAELLRGLGLDVEIERFDIWIPHPRAVSVTLISPAPAVGAGTPTERPLVVRQSGRFPLGDADSALLLGWNAYGASGAIEAPVVYANFGVAADYDSLASRGIDVRCRIVLVRYGRVYRGVKVAEAERRGASAVVLYSDPAENGFAAGDTVPVGPMMPAGAIQLGTVSYLWRYTGDPLTPGRPAVDGEPRLDPSRSDVLPTIPVVPIPYAAAAEILSALGGEPAPESFRGGLPVTYRTGGEPNRTGEPNPTAPPPASLRLAVELESAQRPIWNVIARVPVQGSADPAMIVLGSHHDAWLWGGVDAGTGNTALLQIARALARLRADGWSPKREIVLAFWDAEEMNVAGSTEWVEKHAEELRRRGVAYLNVDVFTAGVLDVTGSHQLADVVVDATRAVDDPMTGQPLADEFLARRPEGPVLGDLGAGSDWNAFWHWAGVPSLQWTMNGRGSWAAYHSALDDYDYYRDFADSAFTFTPAFARAMGLTALRLAEADALPYHYTLYADRVAAHLDALEDEHRDLARPGRAAAVAPSLDLTDVRDQLARFRIAAEAIEAAQAALVAQDELTDADRAPLAAIDAALAGAEGALLDPEGLPGRPWYRHTIYAPGSDTGYDALPLPALAEAMRTGDQPALDRAADRLAAALARATALLSGPY
ncbi:MAG: transferrin receptor-like dimerization domain-containing protein [Gemmatimonadota bacterium]